MRATCTHCFRPQRTCICDLRVPVCTAAHVVVLQHPNEVAHPKGSVPLLSICLNQVSVHVGEVFDVQQLHLPLPQCVLLYPPENTGEHINMHSHCDNIDLKNKTLIVIDSTWRKSRKIMHLNPWLNQLPRVGISGKPSAYSVRKAEMMGQLSTFESVVYALDQADMITRANQAQLINAFTLFNRRIAAYMPSHHQQTSHSLPSSDFIK